MEYDKLFNIIKGLKFDVPTTIFAENNVEI